MIAAIDWVRACRMDKGRFRGMERSAKIAARAVT